MPERNGNAEGEREADCYLQSEIFTQFSFACFISVGICSDKVRQAPLTGKENTDTALLTRCEHANPLQLMEHYEGFPECALASFCFEWFGWFWVLGGVEGWVGGTCSII